MEKKTRLVVAEFKADAEGAIEGYGSIFGNVDAYDDVVARGAFQRTLAEYGDKKRLPAMLWQHNPDEPIGLWTEMREDDQGLYVKGTLAKTQRGREALELIRMGALSGLSIGYQTMRSAYDEKSGIRTLLDVELWEVSPVTFPANAAARITGAKSIKTERDFERFLREHGFSRKEAEQITAKGFFKGPQGEPVVDLDVTQGEPEVTEEWLVKELRATLAKLA
jgi:uncharacterized protein